MQGPVPGGRLDRHRVARDHRERGAKRPSAPTRSVPHEFGRRPLQRARAQGQEPPVVHSAARCATCGGAGRAARAVVRSVMGRIEIELGDDTPWDELRARLRRVFGIANFSSAGRGPHDFAALAAAILRDLGDIGSPRRFACRRRRADKRLPFTSPQVEREVGGLIKEAKGWRVDLERSGADHPHRDAARPRVLLLRQGAGRRRDADRHRRPGGLPAVGRHRFAGRRIPHDAARLLGAADPFPQLSDSVARVAGEGARDCRAADDGISCARGCCWCRSASCSSRSCSRVPPELRVVIYRRLMLRIAERLARRVARARAGDRRSGRPGGVADAREHDRDRARRRRWRSCGRWSAWTRTRSPREAARIGTYPISIIPDQDCCTLFTPRHPATRARLGDGRAGRAGAADRRDGRRGGGRRGGRGVPFPGARIRGCANRDPRRPTSPDAENPHDDLFQSVKEMSTRSSRPPAVLSDRVSVTNPSAVTGDLIDRLVWTAVFGADAELRGTARWMLRSARRGGGHPAGVDSRPLHGDGPRRRRRLHRAGDQRARDGLRHRARGHPRGEEAERRRVHLRDRPLGDRLHRAAAARVRGGRARRGAARRLHRPDLHPGRPRPDQRQEIQQPGTRQGARRRCAR